MAVTFGWYKTKQCYLLMYIGSKLLRTHAHIRRHDSNSAHHLEEDSLDDFTTQLVHRKSANWHNMLVRRKLLKNNTFPQENQNEKPYKIPVNELNIKEVNDLLKESIESCNLPLLKYIINKCAYYNKLPNIETLMQVIGIFSLEGDKHGIMCIIDLCEKLQPSLLKVNSSFLHFLAEVAWLKGNIHDAVIMFENVYRNNVYLRRKICSMLKFLIATVLPNHSEAALITLINFAERIAHEFNDFIPLTYVWELCFLSEWYSDQSLAFDLLKRHSKLYNIVLDKLTLVVSVALKNNRTEVVYRLLEVLLVLQRKSHYAKILEIIFDYRVHEGNLRCCTEIMQWALDQGIDLPALQQQKFIDLLLSYKVGLCLKPTKKAIDASSLDYKF